MFPGSQGIPPSTLVGVFDREQGRGMSHSLPEPHSQTRYLWSSSRIAVKASTESRLRP
jgi:hypothetical protein